MEQSQPSSFRHHKISIGQFRNGLKYTLPKPWRFFDFCFCNVPCINGTTTITTTTIAAAAAAAAASPTVHHLRTILTVAENVYLWLAGPRRPVSER